MLSIFRSRAQIESYYGRNRRIRTEIKAGKMHFGQDRKLVTNVRNDMKNPSMRESKWMVKMVNYKFILLWTFIIVYKESWAIKVLKLDCVIFYPVPLITNCRRQKGGQECDLKGVVAHLGRHSCFMCLVAMASGSKNGFAFSDRCVKWFHRCHIHAFVSIGKCRNKFFLRVGSVTQWSSESSSFWMRATCTAYCFGYSITGVERSSPIDASGARASSASSFSSFDNSCTSAISRSRNIFRLESQPLLNFFLEPVDRGEHSTWHEDLQTSVRVVQFNRSIH